MNGKSTLGQRLIQRRTELGMTQEQLSEKSGFTRVGISKIELDLTKNARADTLFALAKALQCNPQWLLDGKGEKELNQASSVSNVEPGPPVEQKCPLINWVQAGAWTAIDESFEDVEYYPAPVKCSPGTFILQVRGDSMQPRFEEGDLIYVDPEKLDPASGSYVVAILEDSNEATFKQLQVIDGKRLLKALNPEYPPEFRFVKINGNCRMIGTVISHVKPVPVFN